MEHVPSCPFLCLFAAFDVSRACLTRLAHQRCEASRVPESCSSSLWYSLTTVSHRSHARGCWEEFLPTHVQWPHGYSIMIRATERQKYDVYNQIELHIGWKLWDEIKSSFLSFIKKYNFKRGFRVKKRAEFVPQQKDCLANKHSSIFSTEQTGCGGVYLHPSTWEVDIGRSKFKVILGYIETLKIPWNT